MRDQNAAKLLAKVMGWEDLETVPQVLPTLQLLADFIDEKIVYRDRKCKFALVPEDGEV